MITTSPDCGQVLAALHAAKLEMRPIFKGGTNNVGQGYRYARLYDFVEGTEPPLLKHGLLFLSSVQDAVEQSPQTTKSGAEMKIVQVTLESRIYHAASGEWISCMAVGQGADSGDKAAMKAETAARKYAIAQMLNLSTTDDPEEASPEAAPAPAQQAPPRPAQRPPAKPAAPSNAQRVADIAAKKAAAAAPPAPPPTDDEVIEIVGELDEVLPRFAAAVGQPVANVLAKLHSTAGAGRAVAEIGDLLEHQPEGGPQWEADARQLRRYAELLRKWRSQLSPEQSAAYDAAVPA